MSLDNKITRLVDKKNKVDIKIQQVENRIRLNSAKHRSMLNRKKKSLAKIFLSSNYKSISGKHIFSMYEIYTIGGLVILNKLDSYKSSVLLASYNAVVKLCFDSMVKNIIYRQGKQSYIEDRKINKDIQDKLYLINGILLRTKAFIDQSDIEQLHQIGNREFVKMRKSKLDKKHKLIIEHLKSDT